MDNTTKLNITGMQGTRVALKEQGIIFFSHNPSIKEIVTKLDEIDTRLAALPKRNVKQIAGLKRGREILLGQTKIQSELDEQDLRKLTN